MAHYWSVMDDYDPDFYDPHKYDPYNHHWYDHLHLRFVDVNHSVSAEVCSSIFEVVQVNWAYKELQVQCQEVKKEYVLLRMIMILVMRMCW